MIYKSWNKRSTFTALTADLPQRPLPLGCSIMWLPQGYQRIIEMISGDSLEKRWDKKPGRRTMGKMNKPVARETSSVCWRRACCDRPTFITWDSFSWGLVDCIRPLKKPVNSRSLQKAWTRKEGEKETSKAPLWALFCLHFFSFLTRVCKFLEQNLMQAKALKRSFELNGFYIFICKTGVLLNTSYPLIRYLPRFQIPLGWGIDGLFWVT